MDKLRVAAVIFDMDGLLLDTERVSKEAWQDAGIRFGHPIPDNVFTQIIGTNNATARSILLQNLGDDFPYEDIHNQYRLYKNAYFDSNPIPVKDGVYALFDELERLGIKKAVATSTIKRHAEPLLTKANLLRRFDAAIYGDMVQNGKPAPDIFLVAAKELHTDPRHCVVLEDSKNGILAASRAHIPVIMVPDIYQPDEIIQNLLYAKCDSLYNAIPLICP